MRRLIPAVLTLTILMMVVVAAPSAAADTVVPAEGEFTATVDFTTLTLTPKGPRCLLEVDGALSFTGTLEGTASGTTSALVFATCDEVAVSPPGTFRDLFRSSLDFTGTLDGAPVEAHITYIGLTRVGGDVSGVMVFSDGVRGVLAVDAIVAVGGEYQGVVKSGR